MKYITIFSFTCFWCDSGATDQKIHVQEAVQRRFFFSFQLCIENVLTANSNRSTSTKVFYLRLSARFLRQNNTLPSITPTPTPTHTLSYSCRVTSPSLPPSPSLFLTYTIFAHIVWWMRGRKLVSLRWKAKDDKCVWLFISLVPTPLFTGSLQLTPVIFHHF